MRWVRLWVDEILTGSTFSELNCLEFGIWVKLLLLASKSASPGVCELRDGVGASLQWYCETLAIPKKDLIESLTTLVKNNKIRTIPSGDDLFRIEIINFKKYQTVYERYYKDKTKKDAIPKPLKPEDYEDPEIIKGIAKDICG